MQLTRVVKRFTYAAIGVLAVTSPAIGAPSFVAHAPGAQVFGEPGGVTGREPEAAREGEAVQIWIKIGPSFTYNAVAIYYTTDGSEPQGAGITDGAGGSEACSRQNSS